MWANWLLENLTNLPQKEYNAIDNGELPEGG